MKNLCFYSVGLKLFELLSLKLSSIPTTE